MTLKFGVSRIGRVRRSVIAFALVGSVRSVTSLLILMVMFLCLFLILRAVMIGRIFIGLLRFVMVARLIVRVVDLNGGN